MRVEGGPSKQATLNCMFEAIHGAGTGPVSVIRQRRVIHWQSHNQAKRATPLGRPERRGNRRTSAPCPFADARRSLSPQHRSCTGKPTIHRPRTASLSIGRKPRRSSAQVSPAATATHDAAHGSRNHALHRPPRSSARQSHGGRTGIARATPPRRNIEARRDLRRSDQRHRDLAERAIEAKGGGYVCSREVNGVQSSTLKCNCALGWERLGKAMTEPPRATGCSRLGAVNCRFNVLTARTALKCGGFNPSMQR